MRELIELLRNNPLHVFNLVVAISRLFQHLVVHHGVWRGTAEAVLAEAQGAQFLDGAGRVFNHLASLQSGRDALANRETEIQAGINRIASTDRLAAMRIREIVQPLLGQSQQTRAVLTEVESEALQLSRSMPGRLATVRMGTGGLVLDVGRAEAALASNQLLQQSAQLQSRNIEPNLIPSAMANGQQVMARVRTLPLCDKDALPRILTILTTMRLAVYRTLGQVGEVARLALEPILEPLAVALEWLAMNLGGRLVVFPILIPRSVLDEMLRRLGLAPPTDA